MEDPSDAVVHVEKVTDVDVRVKVRGNKRFIGTYSGNVNIQIVLQTGGGNYEIYLSVREPGRQLTETIIDSAPASGSWYTADHKRRVPCVPIRHQLPIRSAHQEPESETELELTPDPVSMRKRARVSTDDSTPTAPSKRSFTKAPPEASSPLSGPGASGWTPPPELPASFESQSESQLEKEEAALAKLDAILKRLPV